MLKIRWRTLRTKIITWSFVPTAFILVGVALVIFYAYQQVTEELVIERDEQVTRLSASQLSSELAEYTGLLTTLVRTADIYQGNPAAQRDALQGARNRLTLFDGGVLILDTLGKVVAAEPERPEILGQDWSDRAYYQEIVRARISGAQGQVFSNIVSDGPGGAQVIVVAVPITGEQGEFLGAMMGLFRLGATSVSAFYGDIVKLRIGESGFAYLVDGTGRVIYHSDADRIGEDVVTQMVVQQVLSGQVGAIRTHDFEGQDIVAGFAPVPGTSWGLITEESWAALTSGSRSYGPFLLLLLGLGVVLPVLVVTFGLRRIVQPLEDLIDAAKEVARGNFGRTITARTGDEIEELATQFNLMSAQLETSYAHLEQRVADRTGRLAALNAIAAVVSRSLDLEEILNDALDKTLEVVGIKAGGIYLLQEDGGILTLAAHTGFSARFVAGIDRLRVGEGLSGHVVQSGQPLVIGDISAVPGMAHMRVRQEGFRSAAGFPLVSRDKVLGVLLVITRDYCEFSQQDIELFTSIGRQIGVAVENARLFGQAERRMQELEALYSADAELYRHLEMEQVLQALVDVAVDILQADKSSLMVWDARRERLVVSAAHGFRPETMAQMSFAPQEGIVGRVATGEELLVVEDVHADPRVARRITEPEGIRSLMHVPIKLGDQVFGVFNVSYLSPHAFGSEEQRLFMALAQRAALVIENARLYAETRRRADEVQTLFAVQQAITSRLDPGAVLQMIADEARRLTLTDQSAVYMLDGDQLEVSVVSGEVEPEMLGYRLPVEGSVAGLALETGKPFLIADVQDDPRVHAGIVERVKARSFVIVPLVSAAGPIGTITVANERSGALGPEDERVLAMLASGAVIALENARLYHEEQKGRREAERRRQVAEGLRDVLAIVNSNRSLDEILAYIVAQACRLMDTDAGAIYRLEEGKELLRIEAAWGVFDEYVEQVTIPIGQGAVGRAVLTRQPVTILDVSSALLDDAMTRDPRRRELMSQLFGQYNAVLAVPLMVKDEPYGGIVLYYPASRKFSGEEIGLAVSFADQAAMAIENARLRARAEQAAVAAERSRLARDLHDAVTQTLFSASLIAEVLPRLWERNHDEGLRRLQELRELTRGALAEMRTLLLELRPSALVDAKLGDLLRQLGESITGRARVPVALELESECDMPSEVKVALYRIAQEALNNVAKHAGASQAWVRLHCRPEQIALSVRDDGQGFELAGISPDSLGLGIMRERAETIGAVLTVESEVGRGTEVVVIWQDMSPPARL